MTHAAGRDCPEEVRAELVAYLDGELDEVARARVEAHLEVCEACRAEIEGFRRTRSAVHKIGVKGPSGSMHARIVERVRAKIQALEAGGSTRFLDASRRSRAETEAPFPGLGPWLRKNISGPRTLILSLLIALTLAAIVVFLVLPFILPGGTHRGTVEGRDVREMRAKARRGEARPIARGGAAPSVDVSGFLADGEVRLCAQWDHETGDPFLSVYIAKDWARFLALEPMARAQGTWDRWDAARRGSVKARITGGRLAVPPELARSAFGEEEPAVHILRLEELSRTEIWGAEVFESYRRGPVRLEGPR